MSIATEFQSTAENIQADYQAISNMGIDLTGINKNIENIAQCVNQIYDNAPKTSFGEGTEVTLSNGLKGKLDFDTDNDKKVVGYGDTEQESTNGYQLFEPKMATVTNNGITVTNNNDGTFTISGESTSSSATSFRLDQSTQTGIDNLKNYANGTYTLDLGITNSNIFMVLMQNGTWTQLMTVSYNERIKSQAITNATNTFIYIGIKGNANFSTPVTIKPMFIEGSYTEQTIPNWEQFTGRNTCTKPKFSFSSKMCSRKE